MDDLTKLGLTPQELNKVAYHRKNLKNPFVDPQGNIVTIYSTGIEIPTGPNKGKFVSVPGYVNGKIIEDENELYKIWSKDISKGLWPIYNSSKELNARDQYVHQVMDADTEKMRAQGPIVPLRELMFGDIE